MGPRYLPRYLGVLIRHLTALHHRLTLLLSEEDTQARPSALERDAKMSGRTKLHIHVRCCLELRSTTSDMTPIDPISVLATSELCNSYFRVFRGFV